MEAGRAFRKFHGLNAIASQCLSKALAEFGPPFGPTVGPPVAPPRAAQAVAPLLFDMAREAIAEGTADARREAETPAAGRGVLDTLLKNAPVEALRGGAGWLASGAGAGAESTVALLLSSLKIDPLNSKTWFSWARLSEGDSLGPSLGPSVMAYLVGATLEPEKAPVYLGRVLWLLAASGGDKEVCEAFARYSQAVDPRCWEPWHPALVSSLQRPERGQVAALLRRILHFSPSPLCFHLRLAGDSDENPIARACGARTAAYDWFAREVASIGKPSCIDELRCIVDTLLEETLEVPVDASLPPSVRELIYEFVPSQIKSLGAEGVELPGGSEHAIVALLGFRRCLRSMAEGGLDQPFAWVHELSPGFASAEWARLALEMPARGGGCSIAGVSNRIRKVRRSHHVLKEVRLVGSDGCLYPFLVHPLEAGAQRRLARYKGLQQLVNSLFARHRATRARSVEFPVFPLLPLNPFTALVEHDAPSHSLQQLVEGRLDLDADNRRQGQTWGECFTFPVDFRADAALVMALHKLLSERDRLPVELPVEGAAPFELISKIVPKHVLRRSLALIHGSDAASFHSAVRDFSTSYAALCLFNFVLALPYTKPLQLQLGPDCRAHQLDFFPSYRGDLAHPAGADAVELLFRDSVPFRYTPNIDALIGPYGKLGLVPAVMYGVSCCLKKYEFHFKNILSLAMRDDILQLYENRDSSPASWDREALECAQKNTKKVLDYIFAFAAAEPAAPRWGRRVEGENGRLVGENVEGPPIDHRIHSLVQFSSKPDTLASLKTTWQAWI